MNWIILLFALVSFGPSHEFHISKCLVEYAEEEKSLQVTLHVFIDDLELALAAQGHESLNICTEKEHPNAESFMESYFRKTFIIEINGQNIPFEFLGKEISEDLMGAWCYLEFKDIPVIRSLSLTNSILTDTFEDQKNVMSIIGPGKAKEYLMLDKNQRQKTIQF